MFGPDHPLRPGRDGLHPGKAGLDDRLPVFGPFGTAGQHCFDEGSPAFRRLRMLNAVRARFPVLRLGRQYLQEISVLDCPFAPGGPGEIIAWSRILDDEEALCVINAHGLEGRGAHVIVDATLSGSVRAGLTVVANTAQAALGDPATYSGSHPVGSRVPVRRKPGGGAFVEIREVQPSEVLVLTSHP